MVGQVQVRVAVPVQLAGSASRVASGGRLLLRVTAVAVLWPAVANGDCVS